MKRILLKILGCGVAAALSIVGGWYVACLFMLVPYNMPPGEDAFIRHGLTAVGAEHLANPDDMPMIALLLCWGIAALLIGALLFIGYAVLRRRHRSARAAAARRAS
ncbi:MULTISPECIES: hypothetical protein [Paraburkholderia]|uniref:Uncharacterized protein YneF (UPF0154 family) n=2 Tax=Paraburkholderia TaxID=1822464 RepID=A0A7Y9WQH7_9BURK|nr:hypothetical protein [Paraburkholderia bryophila]NYH25212.1 uncharacterized protein YneF (UPF0154 family) [Paraburkholderia bryophila]